VQAVAYLLLGELGDGPPPPCNFLDNLGDAPPTLGGDFLGESYEIWAYNRNALFCESKTSYSLIFYKLPPPLFEKY